MDKSNSQEGLVMVFPVLYAVIWMHTNGRKRTPGSAGTVITPGISSNIVAIDDTRELRAFFHGVSRYTRVPERQ